MLLERLKERTSLLLVLFLSIFIVNVTAAAPGDKATPKGTGRIEIPEEVEEIDLRVEKVVKNTLGVNQFWVKFLNGVRGNSSISLTKVVPVTDANSLRDPKNKFATSNLSVLFPSNAKYILANYVSTVNKNLFEQNYLKVLKREGVAGSTRILGIGRQAPYNIEVRLHKPNFTVNLDGNEKYRRKIWNKLTTNRDFIYNLKPGELAKNIEDEVNVDYKESKTKLIRLLAYTIDKSGIEDIDSIKIITNKSRLLNQQMIVLEFSATYDKLLDFVNKLNSSEKYLLLTCGVIIDPPSNKFRSKKSRPQIKLLLSFPYRSTEEVFE